VRFTSLYGSKSAAQYTVACNAPPSGDEIVKLLDDAIVGLNRW